MWIASKLGFYSIVHKEGAFQVRARVKGDLERLSAEIKPRNSIRETPHADYGWRLALNAKELQRVMKVLGESVTYPNFKDEVGQHPDQRPKLRAYGEFWADLLDLQRKEAARTSEQFWSTQDREEGRGG